MAAGEWFVRVGDAVRGPFDAAALRALAASGKINPATPVGRSASGPWARAGAVRGLFAAPAPAAPVGPPPLPPATARAACDGPADPPAMPDADAPSGQDVFWNVDLTKVTGSGCLLILASIITVMGVGVAIGLVVHGLEFKLSRGTLKIVAFVPAMAAGCGVFALGKWLLARSGRSIVRTTPRGDAT